MPVTTTILAFETSCDETGVAVLRKKVSEITVVAQALASQVDIHKETGGVVPNVAAREHAAVIRPLTEKVMRESKLTKDDLDAIAVTVGPGLQPALSVGVTAARTLAFAWNKPLIPIHHLEGHIYSALLQDDPVFPALGLIVSGGHTLIVRMEDHVRYQVVGTTVDDAAGEAFDKVARLLHLPYPCGPHLSRVAEQGDSHAFAFPRPMLNSGDLNISFSGLKTAVLYTLRAMSDQEKNSRKADIAASFQAAVTDTLVAKMKKELEQSPAKVMLLSGGVAANQELRQKMTALAHQQNIPLRIAPFELCGDNAVMIGQAAIFACERGRQEKWQNIDAYARIDLSSFSIGV